mmetsp:Transcript_9512/g.16671  ORF Transcript_9512/g.16671 Transcript_9512/m.16671 type:complete len:122 (+) Transcript_9512:54-419(+)
MGWVAWLAGSSGALAIGCGAFGAHALKGQLDERMLNAWNTGAHYHLVHAVALLAVAALDKATQGKVGGLGTTAKLFLAGTALFSGSLYAMALTGYTKLGILTPIGGLTLIAAWLSLGFTDM